MNIKHISTPIDRAALAELRIGDIVYLNGQLVTSRDDVHERVVRKGQPSPVDLRDRAIFHAGPIMKKRENSGGDAMPDYDVVAIGPTTSMRMESCEAEYLAVTGARLIVGKGGMGEKTAAACRELGVLHTVFPGGCAVLAAREVEKVEGVHWLDLGMPEAMWVMRVREFGPLIVSIDTLGNNLFENNKRMFNERKTAALETIYPRVRFM